MSSGEEVGERRGRCGGLRLLLVTLVALLGGYVCYVQVWCSEELSRRSERQQSRVMYLPSRRGAVTDRRGEVLTSSVPQYDLSVLLERLRDPRDTRAVTLRKAQAAIAELAVFLGGDYYEHRPTREQLESHIRRRAPLPFVLWTNVDLATITRFQQARERFPFAELTLTWQRQYDHGQAAAQVRGFVRRTTTPRPELQEQFEAMGVRSALNVQDWHGASGVEMTADETLAGRGGFLRVQTDVMSFRHETMEMSPIEPGQAVSLSLDIRWQEEAERLLARTGHPGALVALDVWTGEVLVMASVPSHHLPPRAEDSALPGGYANRAIAGYYTPGSTIKPLIALAALEQGVFTPEETFRCPGYYLLPDGRRIGCSSRFGHGPVNVTQALAMSCNAYFCEAGVRLGRQGFLHLTQQDAYSRFFGQPTGLVGLPDEKAGIFFTPAWVERSRRDAPVWREGDSAHAGIGQGAWIVTPLQLAVYACAITTGRLLQPSVLKGGGALRATLSWPPQAWVPVRQGLFDCVQSGRGTGRRLRPVRGGAFAKTGTAEHVAGRAPHAWMFAVAPATRPRYALACVVEEGGHGGEVVAPILQRLLALMLAEDGE